MRVAFDYDHGWACRWIGVCDVTTPNGVAMVEKTFFDCVSVTPGGDSAETVLRAELGGWTMLGAYFPQGQAKHRYFDTGDAAHLGHVALERIYSPASVLPAPGESDRRRRRQTP